MSARIHFKHGAKSELLAIPAKGKVGELNRLAAWRRCGAGGGRLEAKIVTEPFQFVAFAPHIAAVGFFVFLSLRKLISRKERKIAVPGPGAGVRLHDIVERGPGGKRNGRHVAESRVHVWNCH